MIVIVIMIAQMESFLIDHVLNFLMKHTTVCIHITNFRIIQLEQMQSLGIKENIKKRTITEFSMATIKLFLD